jgi:hypothetical protein
MQVARQVPRATSWDVQCLGQPVLAHSQRLEELLQQDLARVYGRHDRVRGHALLVEPADSPYPAGSEPLLPTIRFSRRAAQRLGKQGDAQSDVGDDARFATNLRRAGYLGLPDIQHCHRPSVPRAREPRRMPGVLDRLLAGPGFLDAGAFPEIPSGPSGWPGCRLDSAPLGACRLRTP